MQEEGLVFPQTTVLHNLGRVPTHRAMAVSSLHGSVLAEVSSLFPFDFFPDTITVDSAKVTITCKEFFFSEDIHGILISNIKDVAIETNIFFATLRIIPDGFPATPVHVSFLPKDKATRLRRIIQGLMLSNREGYDITRFTDKESLTNWLEDLGSVKLY